MRGFATAASLAVVLSAAPAFAQSPSPAKPAAQGPARPAAPVPAPAQTLPPPPAPAPQPPAPFPQGAKYAFVNIQRIAGESAEGKASSSRVQALIQKKQTEGQQKSQALAANQAKLQQSGALMNDAARGQLEKEIERQQVEGQRFQQDAQAEINELQQELQAEFQRKLFPVLQQLSQEKGLQMLFSASDAGILWAEPGLDLTAEVVKKMDSAPKPTTAPKQ